jgi:hypothetical protein
MKSTQPTAPVSIKFHCTLGKQERGIHRIVFLPTTSDKPVACTTHQPANLKTSALRINNPL